MVKNGVYPTHLHSPVSDRVLELYGKFPDLSMAEIAERLGIPDSWGYRSSVIEFKFAAEYLRKFGTLNYEESNSLSDEEILRPLDAVEAKRFLASGGFDLGPTAEERTRRMDLANQRAEQDAEKERNEKELAQKCVFENAVVERRKAIEFLTGLMNSDCLVIDSNIWMNLEYAPFFEALKDMFVHKEKVLILFGPQFDEICNIKKRSPYGSPESRCARSALNRIEEFQLANILQIDHLTIDAVRDAYADVPIIMLIVDRAKNGTNVTLLSDDMELRIRVRGLIGGLQGILVVVEGKQFLPLCRSYCVAGAIELTEAFIEGNKKVEH